MRRSARPVTLVLSCEHASNAIPARYAGAFRAAAMAGHRGYDAGSLELARFLARRLRAPLFAGRASRLLVDLNRSSHHRAVFSAVTRALPSTERERILSEHYQPFRRAVGEAIAREVAAGKRVLHLSLHSFTPVLEGQSRNADVGLLYDPSRPFERALSLSLQRTLKRLDPALRVRRNYPYRGVADGHTTALRRRFAAPRYAGIEIEVNQAVVAGSTARWRRLKSDLAEAVRAVILGGETASKP